MTYPYPALVIFGHCCAARITDDVAAHVLTRIGLAHTAADVRTEMAILSPDSYAVLVALSDQWCLIHGSVEVRQ